MEYTIQFVHTPVNNILEDLAIEKLENLSQKFNWIINAEVFFKKEKGNNGKGKMCEIKLSVPGPLIFASSKLESYEAAISETIQDLKRQLIRRKDEMKSHK